mmetsp:Transcript_5856/g.17424  ORF Transcript_5856/g.17424 Transcript_5856/m.17424 type:complete len:194 (-) Transcript_5856:346-927(-)
MLGWVAGLGLGYMTKAQCADAMPCKPALTWKGKPFKLSLCIHSASLPVLDGRKRPFVTVSVGEKTKQTELGDWSEERGVWSFSETLTMEVCQQDEVCIAVACSQEYNLVVAQLAMAARCAGEVCVPVASVLQRLVLEDRDIDGMMYVTPCITFDLLRDGVKTGRAEISFETKQPPQTSKASDSDGLCNFPGRK